MSQAKFFSIEHSSVTVTASDKNANQEFFKTLYDFLQQGVTAGYGQLVALQYGLSGTGTDFHDGANPFGENAFAVFKWLASASAYRSRDFYIMIQWADSSTFGSAPGDPGYNRGSDGVAIIIAYCDDGSSPWNGTTNADGTDTKGTPVWYNATSPARVLDRQSSAPNGGTVGTYATDKESMLGLFDAADGNSRWQWMFMGDADCFTICSLDDDSSTSVFMSFIGAIPAHDAMTVDEVFVAAVNGDGSTAYNPLVATYVGLAAGTNLGGGASCGDVPDDTSVMVVQKMFDDPANITFLNTNFANPGRDVFPILCSRSASHDAGITIAGLIGVIPPDMFGVTSGAANWETTLDKSRVFMGDTANKFALPWDGVTVPNTGTTREGVQG